MLDILRDVFKQRDICEPIRMLLLGREGDRCGIGGNSEHTNWFAWASDKMGHELMVW